MYRIVVVVSTYRRRDELQRLIRSLEASRQPVARIVVNDDAQESEVEALVRRLEPLTLYTSQKPNARTCIASGYNRALDLAVEKFGIEATHYLLVDDDVVLEPDTLGLMLEAMKKTGAKSSVPSVLAEGTKYYPNCRFRESSWEERKNACRDRADVLKEFGYALPEVWMFQGNCCHLMCRDVMTSNIRFDENFWMCGEDLDFAIRIAEICKSIYVPRAFAYHLWGAPFKPGRARNSGYLKRLSYIQNITYMGYWRPYGKKIRGHYFDFLRGKGLWPRYKALFKDFGFNRHTVFDLLWVLYYAMIRGEASNQPSGHALRMRRKDYL